MLDQPTLDGLITRADLKETLANLGQDDSKGTLQRFFDSVHLSSNEDSQGGQEGINFTQFLTMFGDHLSEMDEAATLRDAFECFDEKDDGIIDADEMRYWLSEVGDRMEDAEVSLGLRRSRRLVWCPPSKRPIELLTQTQLRVDLQRRFSLFDLSRSIVYFQAPSWIDAVRNSTTRLVSLQCASGAQELSRPKADKPTATIPHSPYRSRRGSQGIRACRN